MRSWLKALYQTQYFPAIASLGHSSTDRQMGEQWAIWMKEQWHAHGLTQLKQQRNLMTEVRQALKKDLGEDHVALESMNFTREEWILINTSISDTVAARNEQQCLINDPEAIAIRAAELLQSREWSDVAAGIAVTTGRRCSEILKTAEFTFESAYSVWFSGALKRRQEPNNLRFEIPTLVSAKLVVAALIKIRSCVDASDLEVKQINQKYSSAVIKACDRNFKDLIPRRAGRSSLYTHLFRSIYARIATYWYAPPSVADIEYMAAIQGHYLILDEHNPELRRSLASTRHYFDYKIGDGNGNIDGRQGIKLGQPDVVVIHPFRSSMSQADTIPKGKTDIAITMSKTPSRQISSLRLFRDEHDRWLNLLDKFDPRGNQPQKMSALLTWIEESLDGNDAQLPSQPSHADIQQRAHQFLDALILLHDPAAIQNLCRQESETSALKYQKETYLPEYLSVVESAIQAGKLPLIQGKTAQYSTYVKQGVCYEKRTHYAILLLENPTLELAPKLQPNASRENQVVSENLPFTRASEPSKIDNNVDRKLDTLTYALTQLIDVMRSHHIDKLSKSVKHENEFIAKSDTSDKPSQFIEPKAEPVKIDNKKRGRKPSKNAESKIHHAINAIMEYNDSPNRKHDQKWAIGVSSLKTLTKSYQGVIQRVVKSRKADLDKHHEFHGIGTYHNLKHGHAGRTIDMFIAL